MSNYQIHGYTEAQKKVAAFHITNDYVIRELFSCVSIMAGKVCNKTSYYITSQRL